MSKPEYIKRRFFVSSVFLGMCLLMIFGMILPCDKETEMPAEEKPQPFTCDMDEVRGVDICTTILTESEKNKIRPDLMEQKTPLGMYFERGKNVALIIIGTVDKGKIVRGTKPGIRIVFHKTFPSMIYTRLPTRPGGKLDDSDCIIETPLFVGGVMTGTEFCLRGIMTQESRIISADSPVLKFNQDIYNLVWSDFLQKRGIGSFELYLHH